MKKYVLSILLLLCTVLLVGCGKTTKEDVINDLAKSVEKTNGYYLEGEMEIINNEDAYKYNVEVSYKKDDQFRVSLTNKANNHEQIILKNSEGVYVVTPALNKSFKFQSEWPYNNSQIYLLQSIVNDLQNDKDATFSEEDGSYTLESTVNYPNNNNLKSQIVYLDKDKTIKEVNVLDANKTPQIKMKFNKIDMKATFNNKHFALNTNIESSSTEETYTPVSKFASAIYPMYMPNETHLSEEDVVSKTDGERLILTFEGESPFMLVEETATISEETEIIPVVGEPFFLIDTVAAITDTSISWVSNGVEYYISSDVMEQDELINVAKSLSVSAAIEK